jgi:isocitrate dehydrogenase
MMLVHINQPDVAERVHNAWLRAVEDGIHTYDIYAEGVSKQKVGTREFAQAVVERLGQTPQTLKAVKYNAGGGDQTSTAGAGSKNIEKKELVGVDVFLNWEGGAAEALGETCDKLSGDDLKLTLIGNRGITVWPQGLPETFLSDHWRCRYLAAREGAVISHSQITALLQRIADNGLDFIKTENLYNFDGKPGYSQG